MRLSGHQRKPGGLSGRYLHLPPSLDDPGIPPVHHRVDDRHSPLQDVDQPVPAEGDLVGENRLDEALNLDLLAQYPRLLAVMSLPEIGTLGLRQHRLQLDLEPWSEQVGDRARALRFFGQPLKRSFVNLWNPAADLQHASGDGKPALLA